MMNNLIPSVFLSDSTFDTYHLGVFYESYIMPRQYYPYQFDGWKDKKYYGIVDDENDIVYPRMNFLKNHYNDAGAKMQNLNFVVDAFQDFKNYYQDLTKKTRNSANSIYTKIDPSSGFHDPEALYNKYVSDLYGIFRNNFLNDERKQQIKNMNSFIPHFIYFLKVTTLSTVINRSSFMKSRLIPPSINGLRISLLDVSKNIGPRVKANTFIANKNFDSFVNTCGKFGFVVDRNEPWTIVADLSSPAIKKYYSQYNINNYTDVFRNFYHKAYEIDILSIKNVLLFFWNSYASEERSLYSQRQIINCSSMFAEVTNYNQLTPEIFDNYFSMSWQIRLYFYLRVLEERIDIPQAQFESLYQESLDVHRVYGEVKCTKFINEKIQNILNLNKKIPQPLTNKDAIYTLLQSQKFSFPYTGINF